MVVSTKSHVIYSAVFGDYDKIIRPSVVFDNVDYVLFTDTEDVDSVPDPWRCVRIDWFDTIDVTYRNRRAARHFKSMPHVYMPDHEVSVWMDMTHEVLVLSLIHI